MTDKEFKRLSRAQLIDIYPVLIIVLASKDGEVCLP